MYKITLRLKYARKSLEFIVASKTEGNITLPDYYYDEYKVILEGVTYYRKDIMKYSSTLLNHVI